MTSPARTADREAAAAPAGGAASSQRIRAASRRLFVVALLIAFVAHIPALPLDATFLARILLHSSTPPPDAPEPPNEESLIPIDLDLLAGVPRTEDGPPTTEPPATQPGAGSGTAEEPARGPVAAPSPAAEKPAVANGKADDIYDELDKPKRIVSTLKDPIEIAGSPGKIGPKDPNVQILFNGNRLRGNNAGAALGGILTSLPDWKSFFEGTKIDPIQDADQLLIAGPQLRKSGGVFVWMHYRVAESEMKEAIDTIVKRSKGGKWLDDTPVPAALGRAHREQRIFALIPGKKLLLILPPSAKGQLARAKDVRPFNSSSKAGIVISLTTPRNAFQDYLDVVDVPATYKWLRLTVRPVAAGGADIVLEVGDASAEAAAKDGPLLEKQLQQIRTLAKLATIIGADVLPPMNVEVEKDILRVHATISQKGLNHIVNLAKTHFAKRAEEDKKKAKDAKEKDGEPGEEKGKEGEKKGVDTAPSGSPRSTPEAPGSASASAGAAPAAAPSQSPSALPSSSAPPATAPSPSVSPPPAK